METMKRILYWSGVAALLIALAAAAAPAEQSSSAPPGRFGRRGGHELFRCLRDLNLDQGQKDAIHGIFQNERPALQQLHQTLKSDRSALQTAASSANPDPGTIGMDYLTVRKDAEAIRLEFEKIRASIESQLTADQKTAFEGCLPKRGGMSGPPPPAPGGNG
jgi:Spy/CpxP family protein refolding chaperone